MIRELMAESKCHRDAGAGIPPDGEMERCRIGDGPRRGQRTGELRGLRAFKGAGESSQILGRGQGGARERNPAGVG